MKTFLATATLVLLAQGDDLKRSLGDVEPAGRWHYDDLAGGFAEARKTGRPLAVVLRCVP
ncbi:MAG TPA: hypothetical protein VEJ18_20205 [Planctomycetota bacterium]|nr:hypothetical protein [Planctomycetota bacterium]